MKKREIKELQLKIEAKELKAQRLRCQIRDMKDKITNEDLRPFLMRLVGKCFKYRNSYSCPEKPSDYWWLYRHVIGVTTDSNLMVHQFQTDTYGELTVKRDTIFTYGRKDINIGQPCHLPDYKRALRSAIKKLEGFKGAPDGD